MFDENELVWGLIQTPLEVTKDPCVLENDYIVEYEHASGNKVKKIAYPVQLSKNPTKKPSSAPEYGQHTEEVLLEIGYDWGQIEKLKEENVIPD